jgi:hypothetical protein
MLAHSEQSGLLASHWVYLGQSSVEKLGNKHNLGVSKLRNRLLQRNMTYKLTSLIINKINFFTTSKVDQII